METLTVLKNSPSYVLQLHLLIKSNLYLHSPWNVKFEDSDFKGTLLFNRINQHTTFSTRSPFPGSGLTFQSTLPNNPNLVSKHTGSNAQLPILPACLAPDVAQNSTVWQRTDDTPPPWRPPHRDVSHTVVNWVYRWFCWFWQPERKQKNYF